MFLMGTNERIVNRLKAAEYRRSKPSETNVRKFSSTPNEKNMRLDITRAADEKRPAFIRQNKIVG